MMQQPVSSMVPPPTMGGGGVLQQQQPPYQQQQPPQQQWQQQPIPQQPQYQVAPPQQQQAPPASAAAYYYHQPQVQQQQQQAPPQYSYQYAAATTPVAGGGGDPNGGSDGIRSLWIGDLQHWMDETYLTNCFAHTGEVVSIKVIRNKQTSQSEGYGFIEFVSHAAADRNLQTYNGALMPNAEQAFRLNWASMGSGEKRSDDSPEYTVFVGDLAPDVTDYLLQETFRINYSSIKGAKVVTDRLTGRTKGYGFVKFGDESEQMRAMSEMNGRYCSTRPMRIGPAASKKTTIGGQSQTPRASYQGSPGAQGEDDPTNTTLFVGNLDANVTDEHLRQLFSNYGQLLHVKIPVGKRCGFVQFSERSCAEEALRQLNGTQLAGQSIRLSWGRSTTNRQPQADASQWSGGGGGYYGYTPGYEAYGYAPATAAAQDPNMYYAGHPGYGSYPQQPQQQPQ